MTAQLVAQHSSAQPLTLAAAAHQCLEFRQLRLSARAALQHSVVAGSHVAAHHGGWGRLQAGQHQQADGLEAEGLRATAAQVTQG
jgi:hypothetical protein